MTWGGQLLTNSFPVVCSENSTLTLLQEELLTPLAVVRAVVVGTMFLCLFSLLHALKPARMNRQLAATLSWASRAQCA